MAETTQLTIHSAPSTFVRCNLPRTETPYRQILGVEAGRHNISVVGDDREVYGDDRGETSSESYEVHRVFANRLLHYVAKYYRGDLSEEDATRARNSRNCFHFGIWMARGIRLARIKDAWQVMLQEARLTEPITGDVPTGSLTVIRSIPDFEREPLLHGMVKLPGQDNIQVMTLGGALGISNLEDTIAYRESPGYRQTVVEDFFGLDPVRWSVGHFAVSQRLQPDYLAKP